MNMKGPTHGGHTHRGDINTKGTYIRRDIHMGHTYGGTYTLYRLCRYVRDEQRLTVFLFVYSQLLIDN